MALALEKLEQRNQVRHDTAPPGAGVYVVFKGRLTADIQKDVLLPKILMCGAREA